MSVIDPNCNEEAEKPYSGLLHPVYNPAKSCWEYIPHECMVGESGGASGMSCSVCAIKSDDGVQGKLIANSDGTYDFVAEGFPPVIQSGVEASDFQPCPQSPIAISTPPGKVLTGLFIEDDSVLKDSSGNPLCGRPIHFDQSSGQYCVLNQTTDQFEEIPLTTDFTPYQEGDEPKSCFSAQVEVVEVREFTGTLEELFALAAPGLAFDVDGTQVPVTIEDVTSLGIVAKPCDEEAEPPITEGFFRFNGQKGTKLNDSSVDPNATVAISADACTLVSICAEKCWTKSEIAALEG